MKVFYVAYNNRGIGVDTYEETGFMEELIDHATKSHIAQNEKGVIFIYVSEADSGFMSVFSKKKWPDWLIGVNMVVRKNFSMDEADKIALELSGGSYEDVIEFRPYPCGILEEDAVNQLHQMLKSKWGWAYVAPIERNSDDQ